MRADGRYGKTENLRSARGSVERLTPPSSLWGSNGVAFGPDGRLYVAQFVAGRISAVDLGSGEVETVVEMDGPVQSPDDLAFGADGSMYITDLVPGRVWRRGPDGEFTLVTDDVAQPNGIACVGDRVFVNEMRMGGRVLELFPGGGEPVVLAEGLALGNAMQLGPDGHLYYPHMVTNEVHRVSPDGGAPELVARDVHQPVAVRFDLSGQLTVLSRGEAGIVTRIDLDSGRRTVVPGELSGMDNAAFDAENRMFVSSFAAGGIAELAPDGRARVIVPKGFVGPYGVAVDRAGTVYAGDNFRLATVDGGEAHTRELLASSHGVATDDHGRVHITSQSGAVRTYEPEQRVFRTRAEKLARPGGVALRSDGLLVVAETGAGRVVGIDDEDGLVVLAEGLRAPVDVALDREDRCYVSDEEGGVVVRVDDGALVPVVEELQRPQGIAVSGDELFVVETGTRRLLSIDLVTGDRRVEAEELAVGLPPGVARVQPEPVGHASVPVPFAGVAVGPDGSLYVSANGEGSVLHLRR
ncbi:PQQ-binding-like beta-propeller repeat protein [Lentzea sp.]|uniref:PQQ-binding-like beta-propeller repeat protein n=1 Tax=Lentzea sp. TaxID=56099 RepID=UPI002D0BA4E4|nr:PQQ-binding-like beta-propeller repeat protein [Lentzea sp.]HUQ54701.1 PQQ-binding-like beta-propeller repeat protein [Lentzea sp.]